MNKSKNLILCILSILWLNFIFFYTENSLQIILELLYIQRLHREVTSSRIAKRRCQIDQNQINFLYFHVNHRFIVQRFLEYFPLIHSGSWDNPIFEMTILLIFKKKSIFITIKSRPCSRKSICFYKKWKRMEKLLK